MSIIKRAHGYSVECDSCGHGGFVATSDVDKALNKFDLMSIGFRFEDEDLGEDEMEFHRCIGGCQEPRHRQLYMIY